MIKQLICVVSGAALLNNHYKILLHTTSHYFTFCISGRTFRVDY